jgi:hypothetical protein
MHGVAKSRLIQAAREQFLVKEKVLTRSRDALAAERRRMPWMTVDKKYEFNGPTGKVNLLDLFEGRRQLIVYRAFFGPGVFGWPEHACRSCSLGADVVLTKRCTRCAWRKKPIRFRRPFSSALPSRSSTPANTTRQPPSAAPAPSAWAKRA